MDVIYPAWPLFLYTSTKIAASLLEPLLQYQASTQYPNTWCVHDMGLLVSASVDCASDMLIGTISQDLPIQTLLDITMVILVLYMILFADLSHATLRSRFETASRRHVFPGVHNLICGISIDASTINRERKYAHHGLKLHAMVEQSVSDQQLRVSLHGSIGIRMLIVGFVRWILPIVWAPQPMGSVSHSQYFRTSEPR